MSSFRLTEVKNTMRIYVHSFRLCQPLVSSWVPHILLQKNWFCLCKHWMNSENSSIPQICLLFVIYLKFLITLVKGMFDLQIDKKKKQICLKWIQIVKKTTAHSQIFYMWMLYITLKKRIDSLWECATKQAVMTVDQWHRHQIIKGPLSKGPHLS